ncbi:MAG: hypothetical protein JWN99_2896 [Ilumatobacteraceae bacterium]|nr:hypothetical protein [Ilumatobacteraceae bacterium]
MAQQRITRDDLENRFRALQEDVQGKVNDKKQTMTSIAIAGGVILLLLMFFLGKRSGTTKTTLVEIRRL